MWSIEVIENTVEITKKCQKELWKAHKKSADDFWEDEEDVIYEGKLGFNSDHMEHMDYMWNDYVQEVLKKNKAKGDICFGSLEGDDSGSFWGYRFDGKGGMTDLEGTIQWAECMIMDDEEEDEEEVTGNPI